MVSCPSIYWKLQEGGEKVGHTAREFVIVFPCSSFWSSSNSCSNGQNTPPPNGTCFGTSLRTSDANGFHAGACFSSNLKGNELALLTFHQFDLLPTDDLLGQSSTNVF